MQLRQKLLPKQHQKQNQETQRSALINYLHNIDYKLIRNLPISEIQKIIKRKSQLCNWCGIQKKVYFCCDQSCVKKDFLCAQCSIQWVEYPHFQHQFIYIIPMLSYRLLTNQQILIQKYNSFKSIEIKANFEIFQKLSLIYNQIQKQLIKLDSDKNRVKKYLENAEKILNNHQSKLGELCPLISDILDVVKEKAVLEQIKTLKHIYFLLGVIANSQCSSTLKPSKKEEDSIFSIGSEVPEVATLITSRTNFCFKGNNFHYPLISRFYSDNMKGLRLSIKNIEQSCNDASTLYLLNNIVELKLTGQISLKSLLIVLSNCSLKSLHLDYITNYSQDVNEPGKLPYNQETIVINEDLVPLGLIKKLCSNLVSLSIHYPSVTQILSLLHLCSFPQLSQLILQQIYEPENVLKNFLRDLNIRLPKLESVGLATYLDRQIAEKIIKQTIDIPHSIFIVDNTFFNLGFGDSYSSPSKIALNGSKKKRYNVRCLDHLNVMLRQIRLNEAQLNLQFNEQNELDIFQNETLANQKLVVKSQGYFVKSKAILSLVQFYRKKNGHISNKIIDNLMLSDIL